MWNTDVHWTHLPNMALAMSSGISALMLLEACLGLQLMLRELVGNLVCTNK